MPAAWLLLAALWLFSPPWAEGPGREAPSYTQASLVNAATNLSGPLAPHTIATVYGTGLAWATRAVSSEDLRDGRLPFELPGTGVRVIVSGQVASLFYASPSQINFLIPGNLVSGEGYVEVQVDSLRGPRIPLTVSDSSPALFQLDRRTALATHADGALITGIEPARGGDVVILYATGLGQTDPKMSNGEIARQSQPIEKASELKVLLDGIAGDPKDILYAGVAPGFAGLYQINVRLPGRVAPDPEIRLALGERLSPPAIHLPLR